MGARFLFASVYLTLSTADKLTFEVQAPGFEKTIAECLREGWLDSLWLRVLDRMLVTPLVPITVFRCVLTGVEIHPVDSSRDAFRLAGRLAAEEFLRERDPVSGSLDLSRKK